MKIGARRTRSVFERSAIVSQTDTAEAWYVACERPWELTDQA